MWWYIHVLGFKNGGKICRIYWEQWEWKHVKWYSLLVNIFFRGCVLEVVVPSNAVGFIYIYIYIYSVYFLLGNCDGRWPMTDGWWLMAICWLPPFKSLQPFNTKPASIFYGIQKLRLWFLKTDHKPQFISHRFKKYRNVVYAVYIRKIGADAPYMPNARWLLANGRLTKHT